MFTKFLPLLFYATTAQTAFIAGAQIAQATAPKPKPTTAILEEIAEIEAHTRAAIAIGQLQTTRGIQDAKNATRQARAVLNSPQSGYIILSFPDSATFREYKKLQNGNR